MIRLFLALMCIGALIYLSLLLRSYEFLSVAELKRRAKNGDIAAKEVYSVRGVYGSGVYILIWSLIGLLSSSMILLLESVLWTGFTLLINIPVVILVHAILPISRYPEPGLGMAATSSPVARRLLKISAPVLWFLQKLVGKWVSDGELVVPHSKEDLLSMIHSAKSSPEISKNELLIAEHALTFGSKKVSDIYVPMSVVSTVDQSTVLSAVVMDELYKTGFSRFPVRTSVHGRYCGVLYMKDISHKSDGQKVSDVMKPELFYVNEQSSLEHVLNAFLRTKHHLFLVVNEFEEVSGVVTIEDVLEQVIGRKIIDEFDKYDDLRLVARQNATEAAKTRPGESV
jgi:CBS domain containing-hemolysin-like protein